MNSFLDRSELEKMGFASLGEDVRISRFAHFYGAENMHIGNHVRVDDFCILSGTIVLGSYIHLAAATLELATNKGLKGVHVYTHKSNFRAVGMYRKVGFVDYTPVDEPYPEDYHFIYYLETSKGE